ncbi:MAG: endolytic transglycosylase MltG [Candidatus Nomurabacteria bacterium]|jgi:UPF0755 protein|nr:endolytic transglycosylase MltG [Candidatus Nomurabacteria bacterium]
MNKDDLARRSLKKLQRQPVQKRHKGRLVGIIVLAIALAVVAAVAWFIIGMQAVGGAPDKKEFIVRAGESTETVAKNLSDAGLVRSQPVFWVLVKIMNKRIEAGVYYLSPADNAVQIAFALQNSGVAEDLMIRIDAGETLSELKEHFLNFGFPSDEIDAAFAKTYSSPLLADKPASASLEGYIFPDTYKISRDDDLEVLLEASFDNLYKKLQSDGSLIKINQSGQTIYEVLTLASIVGKEVSDAEEQKNVAGVFYNRLNIGLRLGSDVTFHYAYKAGLCEDNSPLCDSAYNTRIYDGLPPGPIANMEYTAIQAVIYPASHEYFYFVAGDDGTTHYSATEDEHHAKVEQYCTVLCQ